ncbi:hypothetical protein LguiA_025985 [Lonicera macranthoides]
MDPKTQMTLYQITTRISSPPKFNFYHLISLRIGSLGEKKYLIEEASTYNLKYANIQNIDFG